MKLSRVASDLWVKMGSLQLMPKSGCVVAFYSLNTLPTIEHQTACKPFPILGSVANFHPAFVIGRVFGQNAPCKVPAIFPDSAFKTNVGTKNARVNPQVFGFGNFNARVGFQNVAHHTWFGGKIGIGVSSSHQSEVGTHVFFSVGGFYWGRMILCFTFVKILKNGSSRIHRFS